MPEIFQSQLLRGEREKCKENERVSLKLSAGFFNPNHLTTGFFNPIPRNASDLSLN